MYHLPRWYSAKYGWFSISYNLDSRQKISQTKLGEWFWFEGWDLFQFLVIPPWYDRPCSDGW